MIRNQTKQLLGLSRRETYPTLRRCLLSFVDGDMVHSSSTKALCGLWDFVIVQRGSISLSLHWRPHGSTKWHILDNTLHLLWAPSRIVAMLATKEAIDISGLVASPRQLSTIVRRSNGLLLRTRGRWLISWWLWHGKMRNMRLPHALLLRTTTC